MQRKHPPATTTLDAQNWNELDLTLAAAGCDVARVKDHLRRYAQAVIVWNRTVSNLISHNDEARFVERHLRESLLPLKHAIGCDIKSYIDLGSGAGLPAIPLALAGAGDSWHLVESRRVKTLFLSKVTKELGLSGIEVVRERLENIAGHDGYLHSFDGFTARATLPLGPTLQLATRIVAPGGYAFLWKGSRREDEMAAARGWERFWSLEHVIDPEESQTSVSIFKRTNELE